MEWYEIASYAIGLAGAIIGVVFFTKYEHVVNLLKELGEAFTKTSEALVDKKITKEEAVSLLKEWYEVYDAIKVIANF